MPEAPPVVPLDMSPPPGGAGPAAERRLQGRLARVAGLVTAGTTIGSLVAVVAASLGFKWIGPPQEIAALHAQVVADRAMVSDDVHVLRDSLSVVRTRQDQMEAKQEFVIYLQCVTLRRSDPTLLPPGCQPVLQTPPLRLP